MKNTNSYSRIVLKTLFVLVPLAACFFGGYHLRTNEVSRLNDKLKQAEVEIAEHKAEKQKLQNTLTRDQVTRDKAVRDGLYNINQQGKEAFKQFDQRAKSNPKSVEIWQVPTISESLEQGMKANELEMKDWLKARGRRARGTGKVR